LILSPECVQEVSATAILAEESRKLTFGGSPVVSMPHEVRVILQQKVGRWLTDSRFENMRLTYWKVVI
jgi:hypothetical protein